MESNEFIVRALEIIGIFFVVAIVAMFLKKLRFPYTIGLVLAGMVLAWLLSVLPIQNHKPFDQFYFTPEVILYVLLPTLIFEASMKIDSRYLLSNIVPIFTLAAPGVLISAAIVTLGLVFFTDISLFPAMLFGALISATDPVAVIHIFNEIDAPKRLNVLVDGESLFNDATAIVLFSLFLTQGTHNLLGHALTTILKFFYVFLGGFLFGAILAYFMVRLIRSAKADPYVQITALTVVAYLTFIVANFYLEISGVTATMAAGIVINLYTNAELSDSINTYIMTFWEYMAFIANSVIFLLLGMMLVDTWHAPGLSSLELLRYGFWSITFVLLARIVIVYGLMPLVEYFSKGPQISIKYKHIIFWGGLRGALPLALALSISHDAEYRSVIMSCTVSVILFTLVVEGTTLRTLLHMLKLDQKSPAEQFNEMELRLSSKNEALCRLKELKETGYFDISEIKDLESGYNNQITSLLHTKEIFQQLEASKQYRIELFWERLLSLEKKLYKSLYLSGLFSLRVFEELQMNIEDAYEKIKEGKHPEIFVVHLPIEIRLKTGIVNFVSKLFSSHAWIMKSIMKAYVIKYEISLATAIVCTKIQKEIGSLIKFYNLDDEIEQNCRQYYFDKENAALTYLFSIAEEDVPLSIRKDKIRIIATMAEIHGLDRFKEESFISQKTIQDIKNELEVSI